MIRTTAKKTISTTVDKMEAQILQRILRRTQPLEDRMDIDVENQDRPKKTKNTSRDQETTAAAKTKTVPFWEELRKEANVMTINDKLIDTIVPIKLKELLSILSDLISHWFRVKRVLPL